MWRHGEEADDDDGVVHGDTLHTNILPAHAAEQEKKTDGNEHQHSPADV